jgi:hypothetical protein
MNLNELECEGLHWVKVAQGCGEWPTYLVL